MSIETRLFGRTPTAHCIATLRGMADRGLVDGRIVGDIDRVFAPGA